MFGRPQLVILLLLLVAADVATADAFATAAFVLGPVPGLQCWNNSRRSKRPWSPLTARSIGPAAWRTLSGEPLRLAAALDWI